jgi:hypothetical protein
VSDQEQDDACHQTESLPAKLTALDTVLVHESKGIGKDQHGIVETDAMLAFVAAGLGFIPLEPNHTANSITP